MRAQQPLTNYIEAQRFYGTQPGQIIQRRDRNIGQNIDQYEDYSEGYYEEPDAEAQLLYNTMQPGEYRQEGQNVPPRNYYTASPQIYGRTTKATSVPKSQSPYILTNNMGYRQPRENLEGSDVNRAPKYYR